MPWFYAVNMSIVYKERRLQFLPAVARAQTPKRLLFPGLAQLDSVPPDKFFLKKDKDLVGARLVASDQKRSLWEWPGMRYAVAEGGNLEFVPTFSGILIARSTTMKYFTEMDIVAAKIINSDTQEEISLLDRSDSKPGSCLFVPQEVTLGNFRITLRFDWSALDEKNDPTLDADITRNGEPYKRDKDKWHHTYRDYESGAWIYHFKFRELEFRFKLGITRQKSIAATARMA
jgi:hypothetical protein